MKEIKGLERCTEIKETGIYWKWDGYIHNDLRTSSHFLYVVLYVFKKLSDNDLIHRKSLMKVFTYTLLILTVELYNFNMCTTIF